MTLINCAMIIATIFSLKSTLDEARLSPRYFTRRRKMPFDVLLEYLLRGRKCSTQISLNKFFKEKGDEEHMSQQALSKARSHFDHTPFSKAFYAVVDAEYNYHTDSKLKRFKGYKILAVDGSVIPLPNLPDLAKEYGEYKGSPSARASIALDVLNDRIVEAEFESLKIDERTLAIRHIDKLGRKVNFEDTLFVFDRGYPSEELIEHILSKKAHFLMRVRRKFNLRIDEAPMGSSIVEYASGLYVRVIKFVLSTGEIEQLITDLADVAEADFKELYFLRWPVETKYDIVKNKVEMSNFTGYSSNVILQDFWIGLLLANVASIAKAESDQGIHNSCTSAQNKHEYQTNISVTISSVRERFAEAVFCKNPIIRNIRIAKIIKEISASVVPKRPDRKVPRTQSRKTRYHHNKKYNAG